MNLTGMFYQDKPLLGLDIGYASLKIVQIGKTTGRQPTILGYGISRFSPSAVQNGEITKPEVIAAAAHELFEKNLVGVISSRRVACSLPTSHTFSRLIRIPVMDHSDILEAIHLEAEQYIPIPLDNLYIDYEISGQDSEGIEVLLVAAAKNIVDSYIGVLQALSLEPVAFEPSISSVSRLLKMTGDMGKEPSILVDIGSVTTDIAIFDKSLLVASTVNSGGDNMTHLMSESMHITPTQAEEIKNQLGISFSDKQQRIMDAIKPQLETLIHEIEKSIRYHSERAAKSGRKISQIITVGGGALMPGLNQYLSRELRLPAHNLNPWEKISFGSLQPPTESDYSMYTTAAGEAMLDPSEVAT